MKTIAALQRYYPDEVANRIMVREGSAALLRALRGEKPARETRMKRPRGTPYTPMAKRPKVIPPDPVKHILNAVAQALDITVDDITGPRRWPILVGARAVTIKLIRERVGPDGEPKYSANRIGSFINREHSSVLHSLDNLDMYLKRWPEIRAAYEALRETDAC